MTMRRVPDWPRAFDAYIDMHRSSAFEWGVHDCCTFAAGAVAVVSGLRVGLPRVNTPRAAGKELARRGGLAAAVESSVGAPRWPSPAQARRGDLLLVGRALAVCAGHVWAAPGRGGLVFGPLSEASIAWRIG